MNEINDADYYQADCPHCQEKVVIYGISNSDTPKEQNQSIVASCYHNDNDGCGLPFMIELYFWNNTLEIRYAILDLESEQS